MSGTEEIFLDMLHYSKYCNLCNSSDFDIIGRWKVQCVICKNCGLVFINPTREQDYYESTYEEFYDYTPAIEYNQSCFNWIMETLKRMQNSYEDFQNLLEIGCHTGNLLNLFREAGFNTYGIEPNINACKYARHHFGLNVENAFLHNTQLENNYFDIIIAIQTFEHFFNPTKSLLKMKNLLKKCGLLFIEVPNIHSKKGFFITSTWKGYKPSIFHLYVYSPKTLLLFLSKAGFSVIQCYSCPGYFSGLEFVRVIGRNDDRIQAELGDGDNYEEILQLLRKNQFLLKSSSILELPLRIGKTIKRKFKRMNR